MRSQWFVIHTLSGQEQKVKESIEKRIKAEEMSEYIKEVLVPVEKVVDVRGGKKTVTSRKLHPGYVYIEMTLLDEQNRILEKPWYFIQDTPGKIGIAPEWFYKGCGTILRAPNEPLDVPPFSMTRSPVEPEIC